jgi:hypothetical protein
MFSNLDCSGFRARRTGLTRECSRARGTRKRSCGPFAWLRLENMHGRNIYIRPQGEHHLSLVDDLSKTAIDRMKAEGFEPAAIVETSPRNFQAWLDHGERLPKDIGTAVARALAVDSRATRKRRTGGTSDGSQVSPIRKRNIASRTGCFPSCG